VRGEGLDEEKWFDLLTAAGFRVAGRDPIATFLTQVGRANEVESVRPRSGLYRRLLEREGGREHRRGLLYRRPWPSARGTANG